jgi:hypothetical protein
MIGGELVREARLRAGLSQRALADRAGTSQPAIARLEAGRVSPPLDRVEELLRLCGFQMIVELAPYDDSDVVQAEARLRQSVDERIAQMEAGLRTVEELRASVRARG